MISFKLGLHCLNFGYTAGAAQSHHVNCYLCFTYKAEDKEWYNEKENLQSANAY